MHLLILHTIVCMHGVFDGHDMACMSYLSEHIGFANSAHL